VVVAALGYRVNDLDDATLATRVEVSRFLVELEHHGSLSGVGKPRA